MLERIGRLDGEQLAVLALDRLRRTPALWAGRPVAFYGFDDLAPAADRCDRDPRTGRGVRVTVSLTYEPGRVAFAGRASTFAQLLPACRRASPAAGAGGLLRASRPSRAGSSRALPVRGRRRPCRPGGRGANARGRGGAGRARADRPRRLRAARRGDGAEEIALVMRGPPAAPTCSKRCSPSRGSRSPSSGAGPSRTLRSAAPDRSAAVCGSATGAAARELGDLLAWLRAPGLLDAAGARRLARARGPSGGAEQASQARALWEARLWPLEAIDQMQDAARRGRPPCSSGPAGSSVAVRRPPPRGGRLLDDDDCTRRRALSAGRAALADLRELALIAPELAPADGGELARRARTRGGASAATAEPGAVAVLDPLALRARRVKALFVCAMQEGVFPARPRPQGLLSEEERRRWRSAPGCDSARTRTRWRPSDTSSTPLSPGPRSCWSLSWHVADDDGEPTAPVAVRGRPLRPVRRGARRGARAPAAGGGRARAGRRGAGWVAAVPTREQAVRRARARDAPHATVVGILAGELDRLSDALVRRQRAAPGPARSGPRAARARGARPPGAQRHARGSCGPRPARPGSPLHARPGP